MAKSSKTTQLSNLPVLTRFITGHNEKGEAIVQSEGPGAWRPHEKNSMDFNVMYTTSQFPADLNNDRDITAHEHKMASGQLGLVSPGGAPSLMHRTQSLDYGIVLEGEIEMLLDSGETRLLKRGDIAVQRATMHAWRNPSQTEWARMVYVLQDAQPLVVGDRQLQENLGQSEDIKPSRL
ncbi:cupin domain-containing protein [Penicillium chermesinum]|uniref:Cupin domain-containing protein n=1 Tax=Penicillium chermesinum TaxID=63820 RepID=A0A9W9TC46_9EURO|nr:cupin domain-containing protein [Penicillium chermesinum]KAJ5217307.1 cupin domain-containing protein [Penicillium chermesinum]